MKKTLAILLCIQVITVFVVIGVFKLVEPRALAGVVAGCVFLTVTLVQLYLLVWHKERLRLMSFYSLLVFLFFFVFPMITVRLFNFETPYESLTIMNFPAPVFHKLSEKFYVIVFLTTVYDLIKTYLFAKIQKN